MPLLVDLLAHLEPSELQTVQMKADAFTALVRVAAKTKDEIRACVSPQSKNFVHIYIFFRKCVQHLSTIDFYFSFVYRICTQSDFLKKCVQNEKSYFSTIYSTVRSETGC